MSQVIIGATLETQQSTRFFWQQNEGDTTEYRWEGPSAAVGAKWTALRTYSSGSAVTYDSIEFDENRGHGILVARTYGGGGSGGVGGGDDLWELYGVDITRDVLTHPAFSAIANERLLEIQKGVDEGRSPAQLGIVAESVEEKLYGLQVTKQTDYYAAGFLLRKTQFTNSRGTITAAVDGIGYVISAASMAAMVPSDFKAALSQIVGYDGTATGLPGEWLKKPCQIRMVGRGQYQIVSEWLWAVKWSKCLYSGTGTP